MGRLVEAHNRCWLPHHPGEPELTLERFKRWVREQHLWCSSCLIAFEGQDPVGFSFGCKRERETLLLRLAVHPDHLRRGHGRHLLSSISSKLAILGPPRLVAEVPEEAAAARALFRACDYTEEATLQDWRLDDPSLLTPTPAGPAGLLVPVSPADLAANGLLAEAPGVPWERAAATLLAMGDRVSGLGLVHGEKVTAHVLYVPTAAETRILALRGPDVDCDALLEAAVERTPGPWTIPKCAGTEFEASWLSTRGLRPGSRFVRVAATARPA